MMDETGLPLSNESTNAKGHAGRNFLSVDDLTPEEITKLLDRADELRNGAQPQRRDMVLGLFFFQSSVRTHFGFKVAMAKLGGTAIDAPAPYRRPEMSGQETDNNVIQSIASYCDAIVLRHERAEMVHWAAREGFRVINGGNGHEEHPSQALIDLYAMRLLHGQISGLRIALVGDLKGSRCAHSLLRVLPHWQPQDIRLCCPPSRRPDDKWLSHDAPISWAQEGLNLEGIDVVYSAGFPPVCEGDTIDNRERLKYQITTESLAETAADARVLCPMPMVDEITDAVTTSEQTWFLRQSREGIFVRQALLELLLD